MSSDRFATEEFIDSLPVEPDDAILRACERFNAMCGAHVNLEAHERAALTFDAYCFMIAMNEGRWGKPYDKLVLNPHDAATNTPKIVAFFNQWADFARQGRDYRLRTEMVNAGKQRYAAAAGALILGEMDAATLARVQTLINEIRDELTRAPIPATHKSRLLKRLEGLQSEMHQQISSVDAFWAFMGEAGRTLGQFGKDVKPLTDRIGELLQAVGPIIGVAAPAFFAASQGHPALGK